MKRFGLIGGIIVFILMLLIDPPQGLSDEGKSLLAVAILMCFWWITEAIPIAVTSVVPIALFPLLKIIKVETVTAVYANHFIFLFLGGMWIAASMENHGLHRRIALRIVGVIGSGPRNIVFGFMVASAFLSMWISNTATTVMMLPIALAVIRHFEERSLFSNDSAEADFRTTLSKCLMLGIAYAASIGGVGSLIGTAPNMVFVGQMKSLFPESAEITFVKWMVIGVPFVLIFLPLSALMLTRVSFRFRRPEFPQGEDVINEQIKSMGVMSPAQRRILILFVIAVILWIFRRDIDIGLFIIRGWEGILDLKGFPSDATVAIAVSILLFVVPSGGGGSEKLLNWDKAVRIPWGVLLLLGGGFALAEGFASTGLDVWLGSFLSYLKDVPIYLVILFICLMVTFLTELTSNTATIAMLLPILAALSRTLSVEPHLIMIPATISASCAFMLPVATPPNAIVFGSEKLQIRDMARAGVLLNILGALVISIFYYFWL